MEESSERNVIWYLSTKLTSYVCEKQYLYKPEALWKHELQPDEVKMELFSYNSIFEEKKDQHLRNEYFSNY